MNYLRHFGLREPPFGITPDTHYFYACRSPQNVEIPSTPSKKTSAIVVGLTPVRLRPRTIIATVENAAST